MQRNRYKSMGCENHQALPHGKLLVELKKHVWKGVCFIFFCKFAMNNTVSYNRNVKLAIGETAFNDSPMQLLAQRWEDTTCLDEQ